MAVDALRVKELREKTGAGILDCRKALQENANDLEKASVWLREKGLAAAQKKAGRETKEGLVGAYIHSGGKLGVLVEVNCETDFVARTDLFQQFVKDVSMQIAATSPAYVSRDEVPSDVIDAEKSIYAAQAKESGKPAGVWDKIATGRLEKFFSEVCLMEQAFVKDPGITVESLLKQKIAELKENITIKRFTRYRIGEE
jgi:elongation factor Ts